MPPTQMPGSTPPIQREPVGPLIGTIIIVCMLLIGALYFWGRNLNEQQPVPYIPGDTTTS